VSDLPTDAACLSRSLVEPAAFDLVFDRHANAIYRFAARRLQPASAEDVVAESFARAFAARGRFVAGATGSALPWLFGIATNVIRTHRREEERMLRAYARGGVDPADDSVDTRIESMDARAVWPRVAAALAEIRPAERDAITLLAWGDLSYAEIAEALGVPVGTVRNLIHRARAHLQAHLARTEAIHG
jgi:RNA polymerase sigma factor (sigma-70 family)